MENDKYFYADKERFKSLIKEDKSLIDNLHFLRNEIAKFYLTDEFKTISKEQFLSYKKILAEINDVYEFIFTNEIKELKITDIIGFPILLSIFNARNILEDIKKIRNKNIKKTKIKTEAETRRSLALTIHRVRRTKASRYKHLINTKMGSRERALFMYLKDNVGILEEQKDLLNYLSKENKLEQIVDDISSIAKTLINNVGISQYCFKKIELFLEDGVYNLEFKHQLVRAKLKDHFHVRYNDLDVEDEIRKYKIFDDILKEIKKEGIYKNPVLNNDEMDVLKEKYNDINKMNKLDIVYGNYYDKFKYEMILATKNPEVVF